MLSIACVLEVDNTASEESTADHSASADATLSDDESTLESSTQTPEESNTNNEEDTSSDSPEDSDDASTADCPETCAGGGPPDDPKRCLERLEASPHRPFDPTPYDGLVFLNLETHWLDTTYNIRALVELYESTVYPERSRFCGAEIDRLQQGLDQCSFRWYPSAFASAIATQNRVPFGEGRLTLGDLGVFEMSNAGATPLSLWLTDFDIAPPFGLSATIHATHPDGIELELDDIFQIPLMGQEITTLEDGGEANFGRIRWVPDQKSPALYLKVIAYHEDLGRSGGSYSVSCSLENDGSFDIPKAWIDTMNLYNQLVFSLGHEQRGEDVYVGKKRFRTLFRSDTTQYRGILPSPRTRMDRSFPR